MTVPDVLVARIKSEFREMPGLRLTLAQACRLWQLDTPTCQSVLDVLLHEQFLGRSAEGAYIARALPRRQMQAAGSPAFFLQRGA